MVPVGYRTAYCGPNGVLIREVSLYRTAYCGPNGVLIREVFVCDYHVCSWLGFTVDLTDVHSVIHNFCIDIYTYCAIQNLVI